MTIWGLEFADVSASVILGFCVILILTGRLIPRTTHQEKVNEAERWRSAYEVEREARSAAEAQTQELIERTRSIHDNLHVKQGSTGTLLTTEGDG